MLATIASSVGIGGERRRAARLVLLLLPLLTAGACGRSATYVHQNYDFSLVKRVAVLPLENFTQDAMAAQRVRKAVVAEVLAFGVVDVVELGQVNHALAQQGVQNPASMSADDYKKLAAGLGAQAIIVGSVDTYDRVSLGGAFFPEVAISLSAVDARSGTIVWSASRHAGGVGIVGRLFGFGGDSMSGAVHKALRGALATLFR